jgi:selT/selW/selH-like putative selenoprotein
MKRFQVETEMVEGSGGVFKVWVDDNLIWDKRDQGRFPEPHEILEKMEHRRA